MRNKIVFTIGLILLCLAREASADGRQILDCGRDTACFIQAARLCHPARFQSREELSAGTVSRQTFWFYHEVLGPVNDNCSFSVRLSDMHIALTDYFLSDMQSRGVSPAQLREMQIRFQKAQGEMEAILRLQEQRHYDRSPQSLQIEDFYARGREYFLLPRPQLSER
ncbi:MAG: hypothetical protein K8I00_12925 [Candidatus Omnitrophica bacterium]|nr:hypothetical protein [Candidatus Omnitrophota bacterium]